MCAERLKPHVSNYRNKSPNAARPLANGTMTSTRRRDHKHTAGKEPGVKRPRLRIPQELLGKVLLENTQMYVCVCVCVCVYVCMCVCVCAAALHMIFNGA